MLIVLFRLLAAWGLLRLLLLRGLFFWLARRLLSLFRLSRRLLSLLLSLLCSRLLFLFSLLLTHRGLPSIFLGLLAVFVLLLLLVLLLTLLLLRLLPLQFPLHQFLVELGVGMFRRFRQRPVISRQGLWVPT